MGHREDRRVVRPSRLEQRLENDPLVRGIEVPGGFVREQEPGTGHQGPADGAALSFTLAETIDGTPGEVRDPEALEQAARPGASRIVEGKVAETEGKQDVLDHGQMRQEPEVLEDDADPGETESSTTRLGERTKIDSIEHDPTLDGIEDAGRELEKRGLATAARPDHRDRFTGFEHESADPKMESAGAVTWRRTVEADVGQGQHRSIIWPLPRKLRMTTCLRSLPLALLLAISGCDGGGGDADVRDPDRAGPRTVAVSNHPLEVMASRIGGPHVTIRWIIPEGIDPAFWNPTAEDVADMQAADLILLNGATYEKWLPTASLPSARTIDTTRSVSDRLIRTEGHVHSHGPDGAHSHGETAFTTWLDPDLMVAQAEAVRDALVASFPANQEVFDSNHGLLVREIRERAAPIEQAINAAPDTPIVFSHPVYDYLQRRYRMNGRAVHWEPDRAPTAEQLAELDALLAEHPAAWFIWEDTPLPESVGLLEERGLRSVVVAPCGNRPNDGDLLDALDRAGDALQRVYGLAPAGD